MELGHPNDKNHCGVVSIANLHDIRLANIFVSANQMKNKQVECNLSNEGRISWKKSMISFFRLAKLKFTGNLRGIVNSLFLFWLQNQAAAQLTLLIFDWLIIDFCQSNVGKTN